MAAKKTRAAQYSENQPTQIRMCVPAGQPSPIVYITPTQGLEYVTISTECDPGGGSQG